MTKRLNWDRAKPYRQRESKVASGTILPNGERVTHPPRDDLQRRADQAMREWRKTLSDRDRARLEP
ncbi:MAG: hypothetical protein WA728_10665 [Xanthobacteraceae bacterium]